MSADANPSAGTPMEARHLDTGRRQQIGLLVPVRERLSGGAGDAETFPLRNRHGLGAVGQPVVEALGNPDLVAPALAGLPAVLLQVVGGGGYQVGGIVDDVSAAVAVGVDRVALECGRHELGRPECAGP